MIESISFERITPPQPAQASSLSASLSETSQLRSFPTTRPRMFPFFLQTHEYMSPLSFTQTFHQKLIGEKSPAKHSLSPAVATPVFIQPRRNPELSLGASQVNLNASLSRMEPNGMVGADANHQGSAPLRSIFSCLRRRTSEPISQNPEEQSSAAYCTVTATEATCKGIDSEFKPRVDSAVDVCEDPSQESGARPAEPPLRTGEDHLRKANLIARPLIRARSFPIARRGSKAIFVRRKK
jgi:hypothetical protein